MKIRPLVCCLTGVCLSAVSAHAQVTASNIYQGLVSYWPMDQLTNNNGVTITPDVVSGLSLTAVNGPTTTGGKFGNAITLDGSSQYLVNTDNQMLGGGTNNLATGLPYFAGTPFTMAVWVHAAQPASATHYLFALGNTANTGPLYILQSGSTAATEPNLDVILRGLGSTPVNHTHTTNVLFDGNWHHLAWVDNYGVVSVYQDGVLESGTSAFSYFPAALIQPAAVSAGGVYPFTIPINTTCFGALVRSTVSGYLAAIFDDAAIWNRALSQAEIQYVMSNSISMPVPALPPGFAVALTNQTHALGDYVALQANAYGTPPLSLQWYENGAAIPDATNQVLYLYNLTASGTNVLYVTASNPNGTATNGPINLVVPRDPAPALSVGCLGYWPLDRVNLTGTATNTPDLYNGNNFNLLNMTPANQVSGVFSNALNFDNTTGTNIAYVDSVIPPFNWTNYTISFWINAPASTAQASGFAFGNTSSGSATPVVGLGYSASTVSSMSNLCVLLRSDQNVAQLNFVASSNGVFDGTWHHVTWVDKAGSVTLYVDGTIDPTCFAYIRTNATPTLRSNQTWTLTSECLANLWRTRVTGNRLSCQMDDVAWWNRALSYSEVQMLQSNTVPLPTLISPPVIGAQPASMTNAYVGDTETFSVALISGSPPLSYQWYYTNNGQTTAISPGLNPSAATASLILTNIQVTNGGYYFVVVTNGAAPGSGLVGGGVTNSAAAQLVVHAFTPPSTNLNQTILQLEFNSLSAPGSVQPGFQSMTLDASPTVSAISGVFNNSTKVTLSPLNGALLADRVRTAVINNPPLLTTAPIYNSFIFNDVMTAGSGIDLLVTHLAPNTMYGVNIWSYDSGSGGSRVSDWVEAISGTTIYSQYTFNGSVIPTTDWEDTFGALLMSDANGQLDIQGTEDPGFTSQFDVFINAVTLTVNPLPLIQSTVVGTDGNLVITAQAQYSGQPLYFQESPDLINWQGATDGLNPTQNGPIVTSEFPFSASKMFYRVATQP